MDVRSDLQEIVGEFRAASERLERLASALESDQWTQRSDPARWSPLECVQHLNLTSEAFLPRLEEALRQAPSAVEKGRYRRDFFGWLLWKTLPPPVRFRAKTAANFVPVESDDHQRVLERFTVLQDSQIDLVGRCDGLAIDRVKIESPFDRRIRYNIFSALSILPRHQLRHLWQAEQAVGLTPKAET